MNQELLAKLNLLNATPEEEFDEIVQIASELAGTPISIFTLLDGEQLWFKSKVGLDGERMEKKIAFCSHTIDAKEIVIVEDTILDERFVKNPLVDAPEPLRFYAGFPVRLDNGNVIGTICVIDKSPKKLSEFQIRGLKVLRKQIERLIQLRSNIHELQQNNLALISEVDHRKKLESAYIKEKKRAEESSKTKELFLANMSHEIRTPLNAIVGLAHQISKTELSPQQKLFLGNINIASKNLLRIINDILDMSKIESGKLLIENIKFNFNHVLRDILKITTTKAREKGLSISLQLDSKINDYLIGDPLRLSQVLINLVNNAIKFTQIGQIKLSAQLLDEHNQVQQIAISIKDTGIGMDESYLSQLFENFSQADSATSRHFGGTGLGLAISKKLVVLMGGDITVESKKDLGSTFKIILPFTVTDESISNEIEEVVSDLSILNNKKILLVEDNEMNRLVVSAILAPYNIQLIEVENGLEAIQIMTKDQSFDLVLMDLQMPKVDGFEAIKHIRNQLQLQTPVMALTANALKGEEENCIQNGFDGYMSKPFEEDEFLVLCSRLMTNTKITKVPKRINSVFIEPIKKAPKFSLDKLESIAKGNQQFIKNMIKLFCEQVPVSLKEMEQAFIQNDVTVINKLAHKMKPALNNLCIESLYEPIRYLESTKDLDDKTFTCMQEVINICTEVIKEFLLLY